MNCVESNRSGCGSGVEEAVRGTVVRAAAVLEEGSDRVGGAK